MSCGKTLVLADVKKVKAMCTDFIRAAYYPWEGGGDDTGRVGMSGWFSHVPGARIVFPGLTGIFSAPRPSPLAALLLPHNPQSRFQLLTFDLRVLAKVVLVDTRFLRPFPPLGQRLVFVQSLFGPL